MKMQTIQELFSGTHLHQKVSLQGWVRTFRANRFIALNDGSTLNNLQCIVDFEQTHESLLKRISPSTRITRKRYTMENIYSSAGVASGIDLSLKIVEKYFGKRVADNTSKYIEYKITKE